MGWNMKEIKKFVCIFLMSVMPVVFVFAKSSGFVCRVVPSESDPVYKILKSAEKRFEEFKYVDEASRIPSFLAQVGNMGVVIRGDDGKNYVLTSGEKSLGDFTCFDLCFAPDGDGEPLVVPGLKISALDSDFNFLLIELPESYAGQSIKISNAVPEVGQKVEVPDFSRGYWESQIAIVTEAKEDKTYFLHSHHYAAVGTPILLHEGGGDEECTLLGLNHYRKGDTGGFCAEKNSTVAGFMKKWRYSIREDTDLPLNLFISMVTSPLSNTQEIASRFVSKDLLSSKGADLFLSDMRYQHNDWFKQNPATGLSRITADYIKNIFRDDLNLSVASVSQSGDRAEVFLNHAGKLTRSEWVREDGLWKIFDVEGLDEKISVKKKKSFAPGWIDDDEPFFGDPFLFDLRGSFLLPTEHERNDERGFDISASVRFQFIGTGLFYQQENLDLETEDGIVRHKAYSFGGLFRLQFPLGFCRIMILPFAEGRLGFTNVHEILGDKSSRLFFGFNYGVDLGFAVNEIFAPYVSFSGNSASYNGSERANNFSFSAGVKLIGIVDPSVF